VDVADACQEAEQPWSCAACTGEHGRRAVPGEPVAGLFEKRMSVLGSTDRCLRVPHGEVGGGELGQRLPFQRAGADFAGEVHAVLGAIQRGGERLLATMGRTQSNVDLGLRLPLAAVAS